MGDIFGKVQANAQAESTFGIAKLVVEYEGLMSDSVKTKHEEEWFPIWLYVLKKDVEDDTINDVLRLEKKVDDLKKENADLNNKVDEILRILKNNT